MNQEFDPKDRNQDGKVTLDERLQYAADKAGEVLKTATDSVVAGAGKVAEKVKAYADLSPEERKAKNAEMKEKALDAAEKAIDSAKETFKEVKEDVEEYIEKKKGKKEA